MENISYKKHEFLMAQNRFMRKVVENEEVWCLMDGDKPYMEEIDGLIAMPCWPSKEEIDERKDELQMYDPFAINCFDYCLRWHSALISDGFGIVLMEAPLVLFENNKLWKFSFYLCKKLEKKYADSLVFIKK